MTIGTDFLTPTTELQAVNVLLSVIGESPISSVDELTTADAATAQSILHQVSRSTQARGWHFNTEENYPLSPDASGEIKLPANTLRVDTDADDVGEDVAHRGIRLYDRKNHTYKFTRSLRLTLIVALPFEELPEAARNYITIRAARIFQDRVLGSDALHAFNEDDEKTAHALLVEAEGDNADYNILTGNIDVARVIMG
ncbi:MAG: hypothetical protein ACK4FJ_18600 [Ferrovibrio sp.]|uniref:hypothetical protein n=1 Tax=Ferrovibrio sp. TaxID=1917215 RepID=UPI00391BFE82